MNRRIALCALLALAPAGMSVAQTPATVDGLEKRDVKNIDSVERRPGVDWKSYTQVLVQPVSVSFSNSWNAREYGTFGLSSSEVTKMRTSLANLTQGVFRAALVEGGYRLAEGPGEGVLAVKPDILDLYVNSPETVPGAGTRSYAMNAGEMRLALEISDSVTGAVLARVRDKKSGSDTGRIEWVNSAYNRGEAERVLRAWAIQLTKALDAARAGS